MISSMRVWRASSGNIDVATSHLKLIAPPEVEGTGVGGACGPSIDEGSRAESVYRTQRHVQVALQPPLDGAQCALIDVATAGIGHYPKNYGFCPRRRVESRGGTAKTFEGETGGLLGGGDSVAKAPAQPWFLRLTGISSVRCLSPHPPTPLQCRKEVGYDSVRVRPKISVPKIGVGAPG
jgi:hypothetical protein